MTANWREYQNQVADFFRSIGLNASMDQRIQGARGTHDIDVWVTYSKYGLEVKWVVECKLWKSAIPKEKVLALCGVTQDVGADRGILLSESGFQAGAIQVAKNTNTSLTSLEELRSNASEEIINLELARTNKRVGILDGKLRPFVFDNMGHTFPMPGIEREEVISIMADLLSLKLALPRALAGGFPVWFSAGDDTAHCENAAEFCRYVVPTLDRLENEIAALYSRADQTQQKCLLLFRQLISAVESLIADAEAALFDADEASIEFERKRLKALASMKEVGHLSAQAKPLAQGDLLAKLHTLMKLLVDTVYLHLTEPTVPFALWSETKKAVGESLDEIQDLVAP